MTLVLSMVTEDFLVQVADRRLTTPSGQTVTDRAMKAVVLGSQMAVAYTGHARLGSTRTDLWIANVLKDARTLHPGIAVVTLRNAATSTFTRLNLSVPQEFVSVGWVQRPEDEAPRPFLARVSNFHSSDGAIVTPSPEFTYRITVADRPRLILYRVTGQPISSDLRLGRLLTTCLARGVGQRGIVQLFTWIARKTSSRNAAVGRDLIATSMPFPPLVSEDHSFIIKGGPSEEDVTFLDLKDKEEDEWSSPHVVLPNAIISNIRLVRSRAQATNALT